MPRVSQVLDYFAEPYLVAWKLKNKDWQKVSEEALRVGTIVDSLVQADIRGQGPFYPAGDIPVTNSWLAWGKFKQERPDIFARLQLYAMNMQRELTLGDLVGHPDFILDDEVIDLKTSKQVSKSHWMQTAQYALMAGGLKKISVLRVDKLTGDYEYKTLEEPFVSFWQRKFQARYEAFCEDKEFAEMMRVKLEEEKLQ